MSIIYCGKYDWNGSTKNESIPILSKHEWNGICDSSVNELDCNIII